LTVLSNASLMIAQTTQPGTTGPAATQGKPPPGFADLLASPMFPLLLGILVLYVFMFRSKRKQEQQAKDQLSQVKRGDEVMMAGGIIGKIVDVRDSKVQVKVDENSNTKIWFTRDAIRKVMNEDKAEAAK
jgi:preprotein translocase subunit YajC